MLASSERIANARVVIIDHFDSLINQLDIHVEQLLKKVKEEADEESDEEVENDDIMPKLSSPLTKSNQLHKPKDHNENELDDELYGAGKYAKDPFQFEYEPIGTRHLVYKPGETKINDYVSLVRTRMIDTLNRAKEERMKFYEQNASDLDGQKLTEEQLRARLFDNKFWFLFDLIKSDIYVDSHFELVLIETDFYLSEKEIEQIKYGEDSENINFDNNFRKTLAELVGKYIYDQLIDGPEGYEIMKIEKKSILDIEKLQATLEVPENEAEGKFVFNLSNLLDNFKSLKSLELDASQEAVVIEMNSPHHELQYVSTEYCLFENSSFFRNLKSIRHLSLTDSCFNLRGNDQTVFGHLPQLEYLKISSNMEVGEFINLDFGNLKSLKYLQLHMIGLEKKGLDLLRMLGCQDTLLVLEINSCFVSEKEMERLFKNVKFPLLAKLSLADNQLSRLKPHWFTGMSNLIELDISSNSLGEEDAKPIMKRLPKLTKIVAKQCSDSDDSFMYKYGGIPGYSYFDSSF